MAEQNTGPGGGAKSREFITRMLHIADRTIANVRKEVAFQTSIPEKELEVESDGTYINVYHLISSNDGRLFEWTCPTCGKKVLLPRWKIGGLVHCVSHDSCIRVEEPGPGGGAKSRECEVCGKKFWIDNDPDADYTDVCDKCAQKKMGGGQKDATSPSM